MRPLPKISLLRIRDLHSSALRPVCVPGSLRTGMRTQLMDASFLKFRPCIQLSAWACWPRLKVIRASVRSDGSEANGSSGVPALLRTGKFDPAKLFISDGLAVSKIAGSGMVPASLNGAHGTNPSSPPGGTLALSAAAERAFNTLYTSSPGPPRETFDVQNFDAVTLCVLAAVAAKSNDGPAIAKEIIPVSGPPGTKYTWQQEAAMFAAAHAGQKVNYEGVSGPIDMASNGDPTGATYAIYTYTNGKLVVLRKVFATAG